MYIHRLNGKIAKLFMERLNQSNQPNVYDSKRQNNPAFEEIKGIFKYRDLIYQLVYRDIVTRYKRSILGIAWTMINPLGTMLIITIVFSNLFHSLYNYPAYVLSGLIAWNFFAQTSMSTMQQTVWGASLYNRIYLPRTTFSVSAVGTGLVNFLLAMIPLGVIMVIISVPFTKSLLILPLSILLLTMFTLGVGLLFSSLVIFFPDITEMYHIALAAWLYLTPIFYPPEILPDRSRDLILNFNPMYYFIELFRTPIYEGRFPDMMIILISAGIASFTLFVGWYAFSNKARMIAYS